MGPQPVPVWVGQFPFPHITVLTLHNRVSAMYCWNLPFPSVSLQIWVIFMACLCFLFFLPLFTSLLRRLLVAEPHNSRMDTKGRRLRPCILGLVLKRGSHHYPAGSPGAPAHPLPAEGFNDCSIIFHLTLLTSSPPRGKPPSPRCLHASC